MHWLRNLFTKRIYADAAAATPLSNRSKAELVRLLELFGNPGSLHAEAVAAKHELENARDRVADSIGAHHDEIIFTSGGTEANNLAIQGLLRPLLQKHGELHAVTSAIEHPSVLEPLRALESEGLYITELPVDSEGRVDPKLLRDALNEQTVFVSMQMINSEVGAIQDIREIAKEIRHARRERGAGGKVSASTGSATDFAAGLTEPEVNLSQGSLPLYFHTDASQAPLWLLLNVEKLGVDLMTLDAQKIMGPKGVGCLYVKRGVGLEPTSFGGGQERGLRAGTENVPLVGSFAIALEDAQKHVVQQAQQTAEVRDFLIAEIQKLIPEAIVNGTKGEWRVANNVHVSISGLDGDMAVISLSREGVAASTRSACDTDEENPSHVLSAMGVSASMAKNSIRLTLLPGTTKAEARRIAKTLYIVAKRYKR